VLLLLIRKSIKSVRGKQQENDEASWEGFLLLLLLALAVS
jgi:hypothetical protein